MKKIGFIDHFLDEWHAENYPRWIRESPEGSHHSVAYGWAETEVSGKRSNAEWCQAHGVELLSSLDELIERSDYLVVLAPDHPERHETLVLPALASGKPTYLDKPLAPDIATTRRILNAATAYGTPFFSSSALRFAQELTDARTKLAGSSLEFVATSGGNNFASYAVHQAEMLIALIEKPALRVRQCGTEHAPLALVDFGGGIQGSLQVITGAPFRISAVACDNQVYHAAQIQAAFFPRFIEQMLAFFATGEAPFARWQSEAVMALLDAASLGLKHKNDWIPVEPVTAVAGKG
jgi:hypothetical protein